MRYLVTIFWGLILGQVVGFLVSALTGGTYDPATAGLASLIFIIILMFLPMIMASFSSNPTTAAKRDAK